MSLIVGNYLPKKKALKHSISSIYGIGLFNAEVLRKKVGFGLDSLGRHIKDKQSKILEEQILNSELIINQSLRRMQKEKIQHLCEISAYRGLRHRKGLPVRGQRTHTNAKVRSIFKTDRRYK